MNLLELENHKEKIKICSSCNREFTGVGALSRKDNKTEICSSCGTIEALQELKNHQGEILKDEI